MSYCEKDIEFMRRAIELAKKGGGYVHPNPLVGCVVVNDGEIIAEGYHEKYGEFHAERNTLLRCQSETKGASLYVTLEPCCHYGKTPPCTEIIIEKGIKKVFAGILDPNPLVAGKGVKILQDAGVEIEVGLCEDEIREMNKVFLKYITTKRPYVIMKTAMTLDGKIAAYTGDSKWVTNEESRKMVHELRSEMAGVIVGIGTILADDPMLNVRLEGNPHQPVRIVVDSNLRIPIDSQLVKTAREYRTIVANTVISSDHRESRNLLQTDEISPFRFASVEMTDKIRVLESYGIELLECQSVNNHVNINDLMNKLGSIGIDSILLEGGGTLNAAFLEAGCVDEVWAFIAPKIIGGEVAKTPVSGKGIDKMNKAIQLQNVDIQNINGDVLIKGKICSRE
ncbi:MAG: bifunctional diaminohydroxyphosphoribosylaminopyrimidine deaminase/5-amino-6-(5-phosphoribosylamino)uracil reductase RibD [Bacteroidales bacterium]|nr:bifunctional diaminohydroxyphosphoribosylaminopyrimidine deaminase/5-amino-6-(5-phosphoribosylamino)uracil reductase RibD [Bacteroidales bacterium]